MTFNRHKRTPCNKLFISMSGQSFLQLLKKISLFCFSPRCWLRSHFASILFLKDNSIFFSEPGAAVIFPKYDMKSNFLYSFYLLSLSNCQARFSYCQCLFQYTSYLLFFSFSSSIQSFESPISHIQILS